MGENKKVLLAIKNTLNTITICGEENLDKLLGCIKAVDLLIGREEKTDADNHVEERSDA